MNTLKNFRFWLKTASIFQILCAALHALSFLNKPAPENETEKQLIELMDTYKMNLGAGFTPTMHDLFIALSACFTLVCLLGGLVNWYLLKKKTDRSTMKGIIVINLLVFGICFAVMAKFTFLPPIILSGLIFAFLLLSFVTILKQEPA